MVRTQSLLLRNAAFGLAAAVFALMIGLRGAGTRASNDAAGLGAAFAPLKVETVQTVEIEQTTKVDGKPVKEGVKLLRTGPAAWKLASSFDYPADTGKVESYLKSLAGVKRHGEPTSNPAKFGDFAGPEGFLEVRVYESGAAPSLSFGVGKTSSESYTKKYVRLDDAGSSKSARVLLVSGFDTYGSPTSATQWIETRMLPLLTSSEITEFSVVQGEPKRTVAFARTKKPAPKDATGTDATGMDAAGKDKPEADTSESWSLTAPTAEPALADSVMPLVRAFVGMSLASIEAGSAGPADDAKFGFDKPDLVLTGTGKTPADLGPTPTWTVTIGKKIEGKSAWYARRATGQVVDPYVFTVNDYELSDFRKEPSAFAEKKPEPPAPAAGTESTPGMDGEAPAMGDTPPAPAGTTDAPPAMADEPPTPPAAASGMEAVPPVPASNPVKAPESPSPPEAPKVPEAPKDPTPPK